MKASCHNEQGANLYLSIAVLFDVYAWQAIPTPSTLKKVNYLISKASRNYRKFMLSAFF